MNTSYGASVVKNFLLTPDDLLGLARDYRDKLGVYTSPDGEVLSSIPADELQEIAEDMKRWNFPELRLEARVRGEDGIHPPAIMTAAKKDRVMIVPHRVKGEYEGRWRSVRYDTGRDSSRKVTVSRHVSPSSAFTKKLLDNYEKKYRRKLKKGKDVPSFSEYVEDRCPRFHARFRDHFDSPVQ